MSGTAVDPAAARNTARNILNGRRYRGAPVPRPLHGVLRWLGDRFSPITHWIGDRFSWLPSWAGPWLQVAALIAVVAVLVIFVRYVVLARIRAAKVGAETNHAHTRAGGSDGPAALEAAANDAEARGDHALVVRLRFRAGLLRLDHDAHAISYRPSTPTTDVRAQLSSPQFDDLADRFEEVTYGSAPAADTDTAAARREWPRVVAEAKRR